MSDTTQPAMEGGGCKRDDLPYLAFHADAERRHKKGERQVWCGRWRMCAKTMSDTAKKAGPPKCSECGVYPPDHKGVCEGCLAYREHQQ